MLGLGSASRVLSQTLQTWSRSRRICPLNCLGSIRFLFDQSCYLALSFRIGQIGRSVGKSFGMSFSHRCLNF